MGAILKRKLRKGGFNYYIEYTDEKGQRHSETIGRDYRMAKKVLADREALIARGKFSEIFKRQEEILFDDFAKDYLQWSKVRKRSWLRDEGLIANLSFYFGNKFLSQISPYLIEKYMADRIKAVKPATVNREVACLKAIFNKATLWKKYKGQNPVKSVKLFKEENTRIRYLTKPEILELLKHCSGNLRNMVICALNTGMRRSEIFNLKWSDVDLKSGLIRVEYGKNNRQRFIPINQALEEVLWDIRASEEVLDVGYVFNHDGNRYTDIKKPFQRALKKSGIENFRFHDLRHTFASHLVMSGVALNTVRELLGHQSMEMTMRYAHLSNENIKQAVSLLTFQYPIIHYNLRSEKKSKHNKNSQYRTVIGKTQYLK